MVAGVSAAVLSGFVAAGAPVAASPLRYASASADSQRLVVKIAGIKSARLKVIGKNTSRVVRTTATMRLPAGRYRVRALPVNRSATRYVPTPRNTRLVVLRGRSTVLRVTYSPADGADATLTDPAPTGVLGGVFTLLNQARATGVQCDTTWMPAAPAVTYNDDLALAAQRHAQDMADTDYFSHDSLDGRSFVDRIGMTPYAGDPGGENIASGFQSAGEVMQGWLKSPGHCRNLMNPEFDHVGLGLAMRDDSRYSVPVTYWVQDFGYEPLR